MRIVGEIEAHRVAPVSAGIDPERTDLPIGWDGAYQEENRDQPGEEQQESESPASAPVRFVARARRAAGWPCGCDGFRSHRRGSGDGVLYGRLCLCALGFDRRTRLVRGCTTRQLLQLCPGAADWRCGGEWLRSHRRGGGDGILNGRLRQLGKPLLQLCPVCQRSRILRLDGTPREEAHLRPTLPSPDYGPCFARGRSTMPL